MFKGLASSFTLVVKYKYKIMGRKSQKIFFQVDLSEKEPAIMWIWALVQQCFWVLLMQYFNYIFAGLLINCSII